MRVEEVIAALEARKAELIRAIAELRGAEEALKGLMDNKEMIVPIGSGVFVKARWEGEVLADVGGGIVIEKKPEELLELIEKRIKRLEEEVKKVEEEKRRIIEQVRRQ